MNRSIRHLCYLPMKYCTYRTYHVLYYCIKTLFVPFLICMKEHAWLPNARKMTRLPLHHLKIESCSQAYYINIEWCRINGVPCENTPRHITVEDSGLTVDGVAYRMLPRHNRNKASTIYLFCIRLIFFLTIYLVQSEQYKINFDMIVFAQ